MLKLNEYTSKKEGKQTLKTNPELPAVLVLKRKYIRKFPGNVSIAVYYSDQLKKFVSIPQEDIQLSVNEQEELNEETYLMREDNLSIIQSVITDQQSKALSFSDGTEMTCDIPTATAILAVYTKANIANKKKIHGMMDSDISDFNELAKFAIGNQGKE